MTDDGNPLSKREQEILELVARGLSNQEIARDLVITFNTVKVHMRNIFAKLEASSRTEAIVKAAQAGWINVAGLEESVEEEAAAAAGPAALAEPPLARWQRVYFFAAAALVLALLLLPGLLGRLDARPAANALSDAGRTRLGAPQRVAVSRWTSLAPLPEPRSRLALAAIDDQLAAIGGEGPEGVSSAVFLYDTAANGWLPGSSKPTAVANVQAGVIAGQVYLPGGVTGDGAASAALEVYDLATDAWRARTPLPTPLAPMPWPFSTGDSTSSAAGMARPTWTASGSTIRPPMPGAAAPLRPAAWPLPQPRPCLTAWWWPAASMAGRRPRPATPITRPKTAGRPARP